MMKFQMKSSLQIVTMLLLMCNQMLAQSIQTTFVSGTGPGGNEGPAMVCDGKYETKWCIDSPHRLPYKIVLDAGEETSVVEYGFVTGDDTSTYPDRNPMTWRVYGSTDMQDRVLLDDRKNDHGMGDDDEEEYRFRTTNDKKFRYFIFEFHGMAGGTRIQLGEINLYKTTKTVIKTTFVSGNGKNGNGKEGPETVCDGCLFTKWCIDDAKSMPYTVTLDAGGQTSVSEYRFVTGDDTHDYPGRNPVGWLVSGSNDRQEWTVLDEQKGNYRLRDENEQEYSFKLSASGSFRYYRFEFNRMASGTRLQLSEIKLYK